MSALQIKVLPANTRFAADRIARGLGSFLLVASILFVLFAGTFPFDFRIPGGSLWHEIGSSFDWRWNPWDPGHVDRRQNIEFFLPLGFSIAAAIWPRRGWSKQRRRIVQSIAAFVGGAVLSSIVEISQALVSFRDPSFADIWCNTLGSVLGAGVYMLVGDRALQLATRGLLRLRPLAKPGVLGSAVAAYAAIQLAGPVLVRNAGDLSVWDPGAFLVVGNSISADAGWNGTVSDVALADRAIDPQQAMQLAHTDQPADALGDSLLLHYRPRGSPPYPDLTGHLQSDLTWADPKIKPVDVFPDQPPALHQDQWLRSSVSLAPAIFRIRQSSQFTIAVTAGAFDAYQRRPDAAPVTILAIAAHAQSLNFVLAQDGQDMMIRVRTAVRGMPGLYLRDVFADANLHHIAVAVKNAEIIVFIDGVEQGRCAITPEAKMIWRMYPRVGFRLWLERYGFRSYAVIYRLMVFIPFAALLGAALAMSNLSRTNKRLIAAGSIVAMVIALEVVLGIESASGFQVRNLIISFVVAFGTLGALAWWRRAPALQRFPR